MLIKIFRFFKKDSQSRTPLYIYEVDDEELGDVTHSHYTMTEEEYDYIHMYYLH